MRGTDRKLSSPSHKGHSGEANSPAASVSFGTALPGSVEQAADEKSRGLDVLGAVSIGWLVDCPSSLILSITQSTHGSARALISASVSGGGRYVIGIVGAA